LGYRSDDDAPRPKATVPTIIDLSAPISASSPETPEFQRTDIAYLDHAAGAQEIEALFGVPARLLRRGEGWTRETLTLGTHNATHVDAPYHYNSVVEGRPALTIDQLPLERFLGPGVMLDFTSHADGEPVDVEHLAAALARVDHDVSPGDIVLVHTGRDAYYGSPDYIDRGPGVTAAATRWLHEHGVRVMGIDAWGWDRPLRLQAADALAQDQPGVFWEAHQVDLDYCQIERLVNLSALPPTGFTVACFPLPVMRASAAPARVVAILGD
jgi:kynurenine formamidase